MKGLSRRNDGAVYPAVWLPGVVDRRRLNSVHEGAVEWRSQFAI
jgi:hypothetical protein